MKIFSSRNSIVIKISVSVYWFALGWRCLYIVQQYFWVQNTLWWGKHIPTPKENMWINLQKTLYIHSKAHSKIRQTSHKSPRSFSSCCFNSVHLKEWYCKILVFREVRKQRRNLVYIKKSKKDKMLPNIIPNQHFNWISTSSISFFLNLSCQLPKNRLAYQGSTWIFICNIFLNFLRSLQYCYDQN